MLMLPFEGRKVDPVLSEQVKIFLNWIIRNPKTKLEVCGWVAGKNTSYRCLSTFELDSSHPAQ